MIIDEFKQVTLTNSFVVEFLSLNKDNEELCNACEEVLERFCRTAQEFITNHAKTENNKREMSGVLAYLKTFEKTLDGRLLDMSESVEKSLSQTTMSVADKVSGQISGLIMAMNQTMSLAMDRLNVNSISETLNESIKTWLSASMKNSNEEMKSLMSMIEKEMKEHITKNVIEPIHKSHEKMLEQVSKLPEQLTDVIDDANVRDTLDDYHNDWNESMRNMERKVREVEKNVGSQIKGIMDKYQEQNKMTTVQQQHLKDQIKTIPVMTKGVISDVLQQLQKESQKVTLTLNQTQQQLSKIQLELKENNKDINTIKTTTDQVSNKVGILDRNLHSNEVKSANSNKLKGMVGEDKLYDLLTDILMVRDGYIVEKVSGQTCNCDIVIKRDNHPTIRVESKAHGQNTNEKVRYREVEKFQRDLMQQNSHGIFVSLYSSIVGVSNFEIQQLSNGKFAIYLSNNNYDIDVIVDMIRLIYKLDSIVLKSNDGDDVNIVKVTTECMTRVQSYIKDYGNKINSVKMHMKESMSLLNEIQLDMIAKVMLGDKGEIVEIKDKRDTKVNPSEIKDKVKCEWCNKEFIKNSGLSSHKKTCKSKPVDPNP
jgi:hypothetical protein